MDAGLDPKAYPMTLNASTKLSKPSFLTPTRSYFDRYKPAKISFSLVAMGFVRSDCLLSFNHLLRLVVLSLRLDPIVGRAIGSSSTCRVSCFVQAWRPSRTYATQVCCDQHDSCVRAKNSRERKQPSCVPQRLNQEILEESLNGDDSESPFDAGCS
jgi:hypothetical protein